MLFIGSSCVFPDVMLRLVRVEFEGVDVLRLDGLDQETTLPEAAMLRLVVIDDRFARTVEERYDEIRQRFAGAQIALAYRDANVARRLFSAQQSQGRLSGLRFIPMNAPVAGWVSMLRLLLAGDFVVPGDLVAPAAGGAQATLMQNAPASAVEASLTQRELEVLDRVALGHRNKIIADDLGVSEHTVKLHIHHIISKIGVQNRTAAANWYLAQSRTDRTPRPES
ncbi:helix-turn-helix transcriptional regulator [Albidovulum aquaemixtae]|nr:LuxR C-terminal-related transcriptional regulator [Defluviimonas aquaemixtae]